MNPPSSGIAGHLNKVPIKIQSLSLLTGFNSDRQPECWCLFRFHYHMDSLAFSASEPSQKKSQFGSLAYRQLVASLSLHRWLLAVSLSPRWLQALQFASKYPLQKLQGGALLNICQVNSWLSPSREIAASLRHGSSS